MTALPQFEILARNAPGWLDSGIGIAAARGGATGILNCEGTRDAAAMREAIARMERFARAPFGVQFEAAADAAREVLADLPAAITTVIFSLPASAPTDCVAASVALARHGGRRVLLEVTCSEQAAAGMAAGVDGLVAKGHEAGGAVGEETSYVLLQRLLAEFPLPVWAHGGIGLHAAAACAAAGAAGVLLESELLLAAESSLPARARAVVERLEGDETIIAGRPFGALWRLYKRPGCAAVEELQRLEEELPPDESSRARWDAAVRARIDWRRPDTGVWPLGQDAVLAAPLAWRFRTVSGIVRAVREAVPAHLAAARAHAPLDRQAPLAREHGTDYPILQGPMTRVSDTAAFIAAVAEAGGLPFLALAMLRAPQARQLLSETRQRLGDRPWGVGILGFVPAELRAEQLEEVRKARPPFAVIAGGRPDQAAELERGGTACYLHVPAPALLRVFLEEGARRFIFEGRECGGHVGPRTSFVLWEGAIDVLLEAIAAGRVPASELRVIFAGGIHDARSAAMVAAMAAPLVEKGVRIGVLMGTAYLFTAEAVSSAGVLETFQREALACRHTVVLESGPGHATRCAETPVCEAFTALKRRLAAEHQAPQQIRAELEAFTLGRLRIASKGLVRAPEGAPARYAAVSTERQRHEGLYMVGQVAALRARTCTMRELHEDVAAGGTRMLREMALEAPGPRAEERRPAPLDIAIVGMGCLLPKAPHVRAFWANILNKVDAIGEIPARRFNLDAYYDADRKARDKIYSRWGGFLEDVPFDPLRYAIPPNALASIDPLQLLALVAVDQALGDAGYQQREFPRERTSVILGLSGGLGDLGIQYAMRALLPQFLGAPPEELLEKLPEWTEDSFAGLLLNVAAGRVANRFNLGGVNFSVDAACASSLAAVYLAARELAAGTSELVVAGGVDTAQSPFGYLCFAKAQALSAGGRCRTFDAAADGIAISEGLSMVVLKRLADAERDGDRIYAVIKSVAGSSDGRGRSMTAPRPEGQTLALRRAYELAGVRPSSVALFEAHGTGTTLGDATEVAALAALLQADGARPESCAIGSVKSMLGHTKSAAGVTGLMKVALALHHKVLPPTLHVEQPNPKLREPENPLYVNTEPQPWVARNGQPRRGGVSAFGFGGTNFHAVLEEYQADFTAPAGRVAAQWPAELFLWRADSPAALAARLDELAGALERGARPGLCDLAAALGQAAVVASGSLRLAIVAASLDDLLARLNHTRKMLAQSCGRLEESRGIYLDSAGAPVKVALLFPGQGSQRPGMLLDLAVYFPEFRQALESADAILADRFPQPLSRYIYPPPAFTPEEEKRRLQALTETVVAQPALGVVDLALYRLLARLGVKPDMTAGHSYGEYVALCAAGVFSQETLFTLSEARGRAIRESAGADAGGMAAVAADAATVAAALAGADQVVIANYNAPRQTVIAGPGEALRTVLPRLEAAGLRATLLPVACAFHSPLMQPAQERLARTLAAQRFASPALPVYSNVTAAPYPAEPERIAELLASHLVRPVRFADELRAMHAAGARVFVEAGPRTVLSGLARQALEGQPAAILSCDAGERHGLVQLLHVLAQAAVRGIAIDTDELFRGRVVERLDPARLQPAAPPAWLVNGAHAYPRTQPERPLEPVRLAAPVAAPALPATPALAAVPAPPARTVDGVMAQYQQLMTQFLETQSAVMTAFLQGAPAAVPLAPAPLALAPLAPLAPAPLAALAPPPPAPAAEAVPSAGPARRDYLAELRRIAAERTGYPAEMLDLDAGIEADLGIDSIKRVEILSAFQKSCTAEQQARVQAVMEKLTAARTFREMAERLTEALGETAAAPAAAVAAPSAPARRDCTAELRRIAAERTGYPAEMLDLDAGIEADLGIDSIKRVEILSAFQKLCAAEQQVRVQAAMEKLTAARTLREVAERLAEALGGAAEGTAATVSVPVPRFTLAAVECPRPAAKPRYYPGRVVLITDDENGLAGGVAERLNAAGERAVLLRHSSEVMRANGVITTDFTDPAAMARAVELVHQQGGTVGAVIHLYPLRGAPPAQNLAEWRTLLQQDVKSLYALARAAETDLKQTGPAGGALLAVATARGGVFGLAPGGAAPASHFAAADFLKTLALEFGGVRSKVIDLDASDPLPILCEKLVAELASEDDTLQVGLPGDRRLTVAPRAAPLADAPARRVESDWVILLTGGARGITAQIARALAERCHPTLILAGTSPEPGEEPPDTAGIADPAALKAALLSRLRARSATLKPAEVETACQRLLKNRAIRRTLESLRRAGSRVEYHAVDVRDENAFGALLEGIYSRYGRLDAVVHGAGLIEDKLIRDKTPESFERVLHTKADSVFLLAARLRRESLPVLLLMSSVTAAFGNRGQADYAAANGVLNGMAVALAAQGWPRVAALNWGPWDADPSDPVQTGMVTEATRRQFLAHGIQVLPPRGGVEAALREMEAAGPADPIVVLGGGPWGGKSLPAPQAATTAAGGAA